MSEPARRLPSFGELYAEIERLPPGVTGEILEPSLLRTRSRPGRGHRRAAQQCFRSLGGADEAAGGSGWWIEQEPEIRFPASRLAVPDLAGWRVERVPELPDDNPLTILPDWCCEVLSPNTAQTDRSIKLPLYAAAGIPWIWLIDPALRLVEVFQASSGRPLLVAAAKEDEEAALPPFDLPLSLSRWWIRAGGPKAT